LPVKNPYTAAILSIADEYKELIKKSGKEKRKPAMMEERRPGQEMFPKMKRALSERGITRPSKRNIIG
jgi:hypothetical protein|tara:strand:- start:1763 stop:1966 length:204 start_codon:yes stop_codon:yes gene_type:complete